MKKVWSINNTLVVTDGSAGAIIWRCSVNKVCWKIVQNLQEKTCTGVSVMRSTTLLKNDSSKGIFLWLLWSVRTSTLYNICKGCFWISQ